MDFFEKNRRSSILKTSKISARTPLSEINLGNADDQDEPTEVRRRRVSFAGVNKIKEFNSKAESIHVCQTPDYEEHFSLSSDSSAHLSSNQSDGGRCRSEALDLTLGHGLGDESTDDNNMDLTDISANVEIDIPGMPDRMMIMSTSDNETDCLRRTEMEMTECLNPLRLNCASGRDIDYKGLQDTPEVYPHSMEYTACVGNERNRYSNLDMELTIVYPQPGSTKNVFSTSAIQRVEGKTDINSDFYARDETLRLGRGPLRESAFQKLQVVSADTSMDQSMELTEAVHIKYASSARIDHFNASGHVRSVFAAPGNRDIGANQSSGGLDMDRTGDHEETVNMDLTQLEESLVRNTADQVDNPGAPLRPGANKPGVISNSSGSSSLQKPDVKLPNCDENRLFGVVFQNDRPLNDVVTPASRNIVSVREDDMEMTEAIPGKQEILGASNVDFPERMESILPDKCNATKDDQASSIEQTMQSVRNSYRCTSAPEAVNASKDNRTLSMEQTVGAVHNNLQSSLFHQGARPSSQTRLSLISMANGHPAASLGTKENIACLSMEQTLGALPNKTRLSYAPNAIVEDSECIRPFPANPQNTRDCQISNVELTNKTLVGRTEPFHDRMPMATTLSEPITKTDRTDGRSMFMEHSSEVDNASKDDRSLSMEQTVGVVHNNLQSSLFHQGARSSSQTRLSLISMMNGHRAASFGAKENIACLSMEQTLGALPNKTRLSYAPNAIVEGSDCVQPFPANPQNTGDCQISNVELTNKTLVSGTESSHGRMSMTTTLSEPIAKPDRTDGRSMFMEHTNEAVNASKDDRSLSMEQTVGVVRNNLQSSLFHQGARTSSQTRLSLISMTSAHPAASLGTKENIASSGMEQTLGALSNKTRLSYAPNAIDEGSDCFRPFPANPQNTGGCQISNVELTNKTLVSGTESSHDRMSMTTTLSEPIAKTDRTDGRSMFMEHTHEAVNASKDNRSLSMEQTVGAVHNNLQSSLFHQGARTSSQTRLSLISFANGHPAAPLGKNEDIACLSMEQTLGALPNKTRLSYAPNAIDEGSDCFRPFPANPQNTRDCEISNVELNNKTLVGRTESSHDRMPMATTLSESIAKTDLSLAQTGGRSMFMEHTLGAVAQNHRKKSGLSFPNQSSSAPGTKECQPCDNQPLNVTKNSVITDEMFGWVPIITVVPPSPDESMTESIVEKTGSPRTFDAQYNEYESGCPERPSTEESMSLEQTLGAVAGTDLEPISHENAAKSVGEDIGFLQSDSCHNPGTNGFNRPANSIGNIRSAYMEQTLGANRTLELENISEPTINKTCSLKPIDADVEHNCPILPNRSCPIPVTNYNQSPDRQATNVHDSLCMEETLGALNATRPPEHENVPEPFTDGYSVHESDNVEKEQDCQKALKHSASNPRNEDPDSLCMEETLGVVPLSITGPLEHEHIAEPIIHGASSPISVDEGDERNCQVSPNEVGLSVPKDLSDSLCMEETLGARNGTRPPEYENVAEPFTDEYSVHESDNVEKEQDCQKAIKHSALNPRTEVPYSLCMEETLGVVPLNVTAPFDHKHLAEPITRGTNSPMCVDAGDERNRQGLSVPKDLPDGLCMEETLGVVPLSVTGRLEHELIAEPITHGTSSPICVDAGDEQNRPGLTVPKDLSDSLCMEETLGARNGTRPPEYENVAEPFTDGYSVHESDNVEKEQDCQKALRHSALNPRSEVPYSLCMEETFGVVPLSVTGPLEHEYIAESVTHGTSSRMSVDAGDERNRQGTIMPKDLPDSLCMEETLGASNATRSLELENVVEPNTAGTIKCVNAVDEQNRQTSPDKQALNVIADSMCMEQTLGVVPHSATSSFERENLAEPVTDGTSPLQSVNMANEQSNRLTLNHSHLIQETENVQSPDRLALNVGKDVPLCLEETLGVVTVTAAGPLGHENIADPVTDGFVNAGNERDYQKSPKDSASTVPNEVPYTLCMEETLKTTVQVEHEITDGTQSDHKASSKPSTANDFPHDACTEQTLVATKRRVSHSPDVSTGSDDEMSCSPAKMMLLTDQEVGRDCAVETLENNQNLDRSGVATIHQAASELMEVDTDDLRSATQAHEGNSDRGIDIATPVAPLEIPELFNGLSKTPIPDQLVPDEGSQDVDMCDDGDLQKASPGKVAADSRSVERQFDSKKVKQETIDFDAVGAINDYNREYMSQFGFKDTDDTTWKRSFLLGALLLVIELDHHPISHESPLKDIYFQQNKAINDPLSVFCVKVIADKFRHQLTDYRTVGPLQGLIDEIRQTINSMKEIGESIYYLQKRYPITIDGNRLEFFIVSVKEPIQFSMTIDLTNYNQIRVADLSVKNVIGKVNHEVILKIFSCMPAKKEKLYEFIAFLRKNIASLRL